jgi:CheY-like chemotaxis protein
MPRKLLLADDSVVIQKLVGLSFANEDVEIVSTDNGDDAIAKVREITPDVVLADVVMPGKSGYEVCEAIKQDPALAHVPVLLLTGTFEAFDESRADAAGADGRITKPFEAQALVERVTEVMNAAPAAGGAATASTPSSPAPADEDAANDFDFFDADATDLAGPDSLELRARPGNASADTPAIGDTSDSILFGEPGEAEADELDTDIGGLALGESVADVEPAAPPTRPAPIDIDPPASPASDARPAEEDATIVAPSPTPAAPHVEPPAATAPRAAEPPPVPPRVTDPLEDFEDDLGLDTVATPPPIPSTPVDLDSALDRVPTDPEATIVAAVDDKNAATSPNLGAPSPTAASPGAAGRGAEDLTVHTPTSAIDRDVAAAPSPPASAGGMEPAQAEATVVANLDASLEERPATDARSSAPEPLDLGPTNVTSDDLDFEFDVSEQAPAGGFDDPLEDSFSSLMDISESQILAGPADTDPGAAAPEPHVAEPDDAIAAGYDVSSSDLATMPPPRGPGDTGPVAVDDAISAGLDASRSEPASHPAEPEPESHPAATAAHPGSAMDAPSIDEPALGGRGEDARVADLSPLVEQRIRETLEKVAWEAFSDLSETVVKQVIGRVEQIAWEVIPQMAETLVREEIRKMKGDKD